MKSNRKYIIGTIAVVGGLITSLVFVPYLIKIEQDTVETYFIKNKVLEGEIIAENDVEVKDCLVKNLPDNAIMNRADLVGKYAVNDLYGNMLITEDYLSDTYVGENYNNIINNGKMAIAVSINKEALGVSDKLKDGDIVSVFTTDNEGEGVLQPTLKYVEVASTTVGYDDVENSVESTVSLIVDETQAKDLVTIEQNNGVHLGLVYRGNDEGKKALLNEQDRILDEVESEVNADDELGGENNEE